LNVDMTFSDRLALTTTSLTGRSCKRTDTFACYAASSFTSLDVPVSNSIQTPLSHQTYVDCQYRLIK
jgi:hypothetical protein